MTSTARLQMALLSSGQAQKEITVNEALQTLDALTSGAVETGPRDDPPASPSIGDCYIVGGSPTGAWAGKPGCVAIFTSGGWRIYSPTEGLTLYVKGDSEWISHHAGTWEQGVLRASSLVLGGQQVVSTQEPPIANPGGGTVIDDQARSAVTAILQALRHHGLIAI